MESEAIVSLLLFLDGLLLSSLSTDLTTLVFPPQCVSCEDRLVRPPAETIAWQRSPAGLDVGVDGWSNLERFWCRNCWQRLGLRSRPSCNYCAAVLHQPNAVLKGCPLCHREDLRFDQAIAVGGYDGLLRDLVVRMKNQRIDSLAIRLGDLLAFELSRSSRLTSVDVVLPVPTHWLRRLKRGFCGAELVALTVAKQLKLSCEPHLLRCCRRTEKQGTLSMTARRKNVRQAFAVSRGWDLNGQSILLVDDVMTSGATVSEIARVLKQAGASSVFVAVVARAGVAAN